MLPTKVVWLSFLFKTDNGNVSDGEENTLPVLTNKIFLTESLPIYLKPNEQNKTIDLKPLFNTASNRSGETMTVEYTSNPIWNVVQALPYLMEYPYECAEQTFNRFFANAMASSIINNNKNIKLVIEKWKADTTLAKSKLQTNEELKALILSETPWVLDAESEVEQQKRLALLLDLDKMQSNINATIEKIKSKQLNNGAFSWFDGGRENDYITQYIVTGIGKLKLMKALNKEQQNQLNEIATKALKYLDSRIERDYKNYLANLKNTKGKSIFWGNSLDVNYWYMRSMFTNINLSSTLV
ncbi:MAG: alpha-2-macroglobulin, partial [Bacteroidetes bacterium]|nr:alpha-2-macroglobulin [Bacteroidota bacterium]